MLTLVLPLRCVSRPWLAHLERARAISDRGNLSGLFCRARNATPPRGATHARRLRRNEATKARLSPASRVSTVVASAKRCLTHERSRREISPRAVLSSSRSPFLSMRYRTGSERAKRRRRCPSGPSTMPPTFDATRFRIARRFLTVRGQQTGVVRALCRTSECEEAALTIGNNTKENLYQRRHPSTHMQLANSSRLQSKPRTLLTC